jgi:predicted HTH domain antitoxin
MPRQEDEPIERIHINLFSTDLEWLRSNYRREESVGVGKAVRTIVRNSVKRMQDLQASRQKPIRPLDDEELEALAEEAHNHA